MKHADLIQKMTVEGIVSAVNGHFFRGMGKTIKGYFANAKANKEYAKS